MPVSAPNVTTTVVPAPADGLRTLLIPARLDPLASADVVHFPFSLLGRGLPCASVVTNHDLMWLEHAELVDARPLVRRVRESFYQTGMRYALRHATRLIAVSRATADRIHAVVARELRASARDPQRGKPCLRGADQSRSRLGQAARAGWK